MAYSQFRKYEHKGSMAQATVSMRIFEDETQGLHSVIRNLPAGMDIAPDVWRFEKQGHAENKFNAVCRDLESRNFECIQTGHI